MSDRDGGQVEEALQRLADRDMTRRHLLRDVARGGLLVGGLASMPALLAACAQPAVTSAPPSGPTTAPAAPKPTAAVERVRLGHLSPLTGSLATGAISLRNGCQLAVDDVMAAGGVKALRGVPLEVIYADTRGDNAVGASEAQRLITVERVSGLMGAYQSGVCKVISDQAERSEVPFLINTGVLETLTGPDKKYTFRHSAKASEFAVSQVQYLVDIGKQSGNPVKSVALIHDNGDFGQATGKAWHDALSKYASDMKILLEESIPPDQADLTSTIAKTKAAGPDAILIAAYPQADFLLTNGFAQQKVVTRAILFSSGGPSNSSYFSNTGKNGEFFYAANNWADDVAFTGSADIQARYKKAFGENLNSIAMLAYAGVWILKEAVEKAASVDPKAVRNALAKIRLDSGPVMAMSASAVEFDATGQITERPKMVGQVLGGSLKTVWPFGLSKTKPVYPMPSWDGR